MAKSKKTKKLNSDAIFAKKSGAAAAANPFASAASTTKKMNPFEVHVNKEKFQILGRTCKHDKGLPGVSRAKAVKKRKETLGQEYREKNKTNQFKDRRIGKSFDGPQLNEDLLNARFVADKLTQFKQTKMSRFNLNDDEVLTHRGQTLEEIEQFQDNRSDDGDEDDEALNAEFTEAANFGGDVAHQKDRKTAIEDMIVDQKRRKAETAKDKEEVFNLTEKLDTNYKDLIGLMGKMTKEEMKAKPGPDDYDKIMREMVFEPRGVVADKLISEEEQAKQEKQRLEDLERARLVRMRGDDESADQQKPTHRSADDLDDGYFGYGVEQEEPTLAYSLDGTFNSNTNGNNKIQNEDEVEAEDEQLSGEEESDEDAEEGTEEEESDSENEDEDHLSDLKESDSEEEVEDVVEKKLPKQPSAIKNKQLKIESAKKIIRSDLPFTIEMPGSSKEFAALIKAHTPDDQATLVERLIKCNHPKLDGVNREKVIKLFTYLLQYIEEMFVDASTEDVALHFKILAGMTPLLYDLLHLNPERMSLLLLNAIKAKYIEFKKNSKMYPTLDTFVLLKLVSNFFTTSDFRHPVVTPCYIFAHHILSKARARTRQDIAMGLFLVTIVLEYSQQSRRFLPAAWNYLLGIVYLAIPKRPIEVLNILPPFQSTGPLSKLLAIAENTDHEASTEELMNSEDLVTTTLTPDFKIRALNTSLKLIKDAISVVSENVGAQYMAAPLLAMLERLPLKAYPEYVHTNYEQTKVALETMLKQTFTKLVPPERKPKALRLLEPRIETVYDDKRRPKLTKEKEDKVKLMAKFKRATKGAVREIRRDTEFLQKMRLNQILQSDRERKEKVKRIYQEASVQQGELNELARAKKKKKF